MRKIEKYCKKSCSKKQKDLLEILNKFQDDIAKCFFDAKVKDKS